MKVSEVMTPDPICCVPRDSAEKVAKLLRDHNIGSVPVVLDYKTRQLIGIITDRDLCCTVVASGLEPKATPIKRYITSNPITCRADDNVEICVHAMQTYQIRRIPVVDDENRCIGIVSQADLLLHHQTEQMFETLVEVSRSRPESFSLTA
ncbi:MAG TPA: CBS domain-containing protein [Candidatus Angelobacter sp.]|nr:CBS domain-containing protein [Candidatus Angelobacter sp.]